MKKSTFDQLVKLCRNYRVFTCMIESYWQMEEANKLNAELDRQFNLLMQEDWDGYNKGVPGCATNCGLRTAEELRQWLWDSDVDLEGFRYDEEKDEVVEEKARRVWTAEEIKVLIQTNDKVLYGALKRMYNEQTEDEKASGETSHKNGTGYNGVDAKVMTSITQFLLQRGFLTVKQKELARKKLVKYNGQLTRLANL